MRSAVITVAFVLAIGASFVVSVQAQPLTPAQPPPSGPAQPAAQPQAAEIPAAFPWEGEVTGSNVYLRSGAGVNWYPTTKLNPGDRVLVLGEKFGWYQITPPKGSFSYVDKAVVDRQAPDSKVGTIKQDKVYVRAGSEIEDRKSATQLVVDKGVKVEILGEVEGFYKIAPPRGACLYVSKTYVEPVAARLRTGLAEQYSAAAPKPETKPGETTPPGAVAPAVAAPGTPAVQPTEGAVPAPSTQPASIEDGLPLEPDESIEALKTKASPAQKPGATKSPAGPAPARGEKGAAAARTPPTKPRYQVMLDQVENLMRAELRRPVKEQDLAPLLNRYEEIASQKEENVPAQIAKVRIQQLKDWQALAATQDDTNASAAELASFRERLNEERMKIMRRRVEEAALKYDLEGELRKSWAFANQQHRYRLVDPVKGTTIAYVDIPPTVDVNVNNLIGRVVGIVASDKQFSPSARVPVAVAAKVVDLSPRGVSGQTPGPATPPENTETPIGKSTSEGGKAQGGRPGEERPPVADPEPDQPQ